MLLEIKSLLFSWSSTKMYNIQKIKKKINAYVELYDLQQS